MRAGIGMVALAVVLPLAGCGGDGDVAASETTDTGDGVADEISTEGAEDLTGMTEVEVEARDNIFVSEVIAVDPGVYAYYRVLHGTPTAGMISTVVVGTPDAAS